MFLYLQNLCHLEFVSGEEVLLLLSIHQISIVSLVSLYSVSSLASNVLILNVINVSIIKK